MKMYMILLTSVMGVGLLGSCTDAEEKLEQQIEMDRSRELFCQAEEIGVYRAGNPLWIFDGSKQQLAMNESANYDAAYLWTTGDDATGIVSAVAYDPDSRRISFTVPDPLVPGSVVVALYEKSSRQIVWSWHLWVNATVGENQIGNYAWMNQNLGATSASDADELGSYGFYYQFGRKDPEICAKEIGSIDGVVEETAFADKTALTTINTELFPDAAWEYHAEGVSLEESVRKPMRHSAAGANSAFTSDVNLKTIWGMARRQCTIRVLRAIRSLPGLNSPRL